ncbi:juvenile hormone acid O-methyltransferase-like [Periplaneta americana]|uniref:juvenile hormone acid O-methyltransferase-like n=1 Tax=Periplaneta americana TaxID=6978 RepID=UPI0037E9AD56
MLKAEDYVKVTSLSERDSEDLLSEYLVSMTWKAGERVLDLGCGPCLVTMKVLLPRLPEDIEILVGTDVSSDMLQLASSKYPHPKLKLIQMDLGKEIPAVSELRTPGFDKIFSFHALHWIPDQRQVVTNIYNMLRPGGVALLSLVARSYVGTAFLNQSRKKEWQPYVEDFQKIFLPYQYSQDPAEDFKNILKDVGFEIIDCKCRELTYDFKLTSRMKDFITVINPFVSQMPKELQDICITDYLMELTKIKFAREGKEDNNVTELNYDQIVAYIKKV